MAGGVIYIAKFIQGSGRNQMKKHVVYKAILGHRQAFINKTGSRISSLLLHLISIARDLNDQKHIIWGQRCPEKASLLEELPKQEKERGSDVGMFLL